jgi:hypothetical protein
MLSSLRSRVRRLLGRRGKKIVFILSSRRSGSTWVGYVLGGGPDAAFLGEYYRGWTEGIGQPCAWCEVNGVRPCSVLGDVAEVPVASAFEHAFERTGAATLVDSSKDIAWARRFAEKGYDVRFVHVMRDPRGWYASEHRRSAVPLSELMAWWVDDSRRIAAFLRETGMPQVTAFYDELAAAPEPAFRALFRALGMPFAPRALRYWERPQHGFAANGASSMLLSGRSNSAGFDQFVTGDDAYYARRYRTQFTDERWRELLSADDVRAIEAAPGVAAVLRSHGRELIATGLVRAR